MKRNSINQSVQKETNLAAVLRALRAGYATTRVELAEATGLAQASITKIVAQLIEWGAVSECESVGTGVGRKAVRLRINAGEFRVAAARINRRYMITAIYDLEGRQYDAIQQRISHEDGARASTERLVDQMRTLLARAERPPMSVGVAVPGPFNCRTGRITLMSGFPGWSEIDLREALTSATGLPTFVEQDANCGALAELWHAGEAAESDLIFVAADRGIGAGLILDYEIYRGHEGYAGEIGHSSINVFGPRCECGNRGCLEMYGSAIALENAYRQDVFDPSEPASAAADVNAERILEMVREGDPVARRAYRKTVAYLCFGLVGMINTLNPKAVVFSDRLVDGGELFLETARQTFQQYLMPEIYENLRVKVCTLNGDPMLLGASVLAFNQMLQTPSAYFQRNNIR